MSALLYRQTSVVFQYNFNSKAQVVVNQGGTSSGKTYAILQVLFCLAYATEKQVITVVGQDIPNLKAGALRDAHNIVASSAALQQMVEKYNDSDRIFKLRNGSLIEFKSFGDGQDAKSGKRDYLFINEANGISWDVYNELALRTRKRIFIDYNPNSEFWVHERLIGQAGVQLVISDHRHNPFIAADMRDKIERLKHEDQELWKVYARGLTGKITGLVFNNWHICDEVPFGARLLAAGLDFGYSNDETACLLVYKQSGELWVEEVIYQTGLTNTDIARKLADAGISKGTQIIADCAEPKSIEELKRMGWWVTPASKGKDSVTHSIDVLKRYTINVTRGSINLRKELGKYKWRTDSAGKAVNQPVDSCNHAIDALRYVALNVLRSKGSNKIKSKLAVLPTYTERPFWEDFL